MGLPNVPTDSAGSMMVGMGSRFTNERTAKQEHEENLLDGELICYGPWDDDNLYARIWNRSVGRKYIIEAQEEMNDYIIQFSGLWAGFNKPPSRPKRPSSAAYEIMKRRPVCPSLTNDSTLSDSTWVTQRHVISDSSLDIDQVSSSLRNINWSTEPKTASTKREYCQTVSNNLLRMGTPEPQDDEVKREDNANSTRSQIATLVEPNYPEGSIRSQISNASDSGIGLADPETPTDTSFEDDDDDDDEDEDEDGEGQSESLNQDIRQIFSATPQFAEQVIDYLERLPPDRRERVYGYGATSSRGAESPHGSNNPSGYDGGSRPNKRKRAGEPSPSGTQGQLREDKDEESQVLVDDQSPETAPLNRNFACGYNVYDRGKYGPRSAVRRDAKRYKSCGGPGFKNINHYKRHLERVHISHQCPRCGLLFEEPGQLPTHLAEERRCSQSNFEQEGGMSQAMWDAVKKIFRRIRKAQEDTSDEERWFLVWETLFPGVDRPPTAYYEEQQGLDVYPLITTRVSELFGALLANQPRLAQVSAHRDELMEALRHAFQIVGRNTPMELQAGDLNSPLTSSQAPVPASIQEQTPHVDLTTNPSHLHNPAEVYSMTMGSVGDSIYPDDGAGIDPQFVISDLNVFSQDADNSEDQMEEQDIFGMSFMDMGT